MIPKAFIDQWRKVAGWESGNSRGNSRRFCAFRAQSQTVMNSL
jgi:hypothetical protein